MWRTAGKEAGIRTIEQIALALETTLGQFFDPL
jgi:hypothetical protein